MVTFSTNFKLEAFIAQNKNRMRVYNEGIVYLKDKDNFQIELFNGETFDILATIKLNGKLISSKGLIIRPGERVFLDRWIDIAKKFVFNTYDVENTSSSKDAIKNNGEVEILMYREVEHYHYINWHINPNYYGGNFNVTPTSGVTYGTDINQFSSTIETGKTEMGENSNQKLKEVANRSFESIPSAEFKYKLLPISLAPSQVSDIRYCTTCGSKLKKSWKFCAHCGSKV